MDLTSTQVADIVNNAKNAANEAAKRELAAQVNHGYCGFAWTNIWAYEGKKIRANSKLGKALIAADVTKNYEGAYCLWNPSMLGVQSMGILEVGARAAAEVFKAAGFSACAGSRVD